MIKCYFEDGIQVSLRHIAVTAVIIRDQKILLVKRAAHISEAGKYALPGGFLNRDETMSEGIAREIKEETGYEVQSSQLFRIIDNPNRPNENRQNVEFAYLAEVGEQTGKPDDESSEVKWFDLDKLPPTEDFAFDHHDTVQMYIDQHS